jgi:tRNA-binding protein
MTKSLLTDWSVGKNTHILCMAIFEAGDTTRAEFVVAMPTFEDFLALDLRVGRIVQVELFPEARRPAYKLWIDFGPELGIKQSSAQITERYQPAGLVGRLIIAVVNMPPKRVAGFTSEVLVLGVPDEHGAVVLIRPDAEVPLGGRVF